MANPKDLPRDIGGFIRDLRRSAKISLRQLAKQAGVSNPYLSQVERGLRKPSAEVLRQLASALRISTPMMYLRAGLLDDKDGPGVLAAIAADDGLTMAQKQTLSQIYETFRRENARLAEAMRAGDTRPAGQVEPAEQPEPEPAELRVPAETVVPPKPVVSPKPVPKSASVRASGESTVGLTEGVLESVAVSEAGAATETRGETGTDSADKGT